MVVDRSGASSKNTDVEFLKLFYAIFKDHYPARGEVFLIYGEPPPIYLSLLVVVLAAWM